MSDTAPATCDRQKGFLRTEERLVGAIVQSPALTVLQVAGFINSQDDLDGPARIILSAAIDLAQVGISPTPEFVIDELRRSGQLDRRTACWLACATAHCTPPGSVRRYAAMVVAASLRRRVRNWSTTLASLAETGSETDLAVTTEVVATKIAEGFERLRFLRQCTDG